MNRKQREKNRGNARWLSWHAHICPECGEHGKHFVVPPGGYTLAHALYGRPPEGFWTCSKFYGPDGKRTEGPRT